MFAVTSTDVYTMRLPSAERLGCARYGAGVVIGSGSPLVLPDVSLIGTRQRFVLPPLSLAK
jgi:hypothetical protein